MSFKMLNYLKNMLTGKYGENTPPKKVEDMTLEEYNKTIEAKSISSLNPEYVKREVPGNNPNPGNINIIDVGDYIKSVAPKSANSVDTREVDNIKVSLNNRMNVDELFDENNIEEGENNEEGEKSIICDENQTEKITPLTKEQEAEIRLKPINDLPTIIMNNLLPYNYRTLAFDIYHDEFKDSSISIVRTISGQYSFSGDIITEKFIKYLIDNSSLSAVLKIDFAQSLCSFIKDKIDDVLEQKDELDYQLDRIHKRLGTRKRRNTRKMTEEEVSFLYEEVENDLKFYKSMQHEAYSYYLKSLGKKDKGVYVSNMEGVSNTCKIKYLIELADSLLFPKETREIFYDIMKDERIDIKFRYVSLLSTEKSLDETLCINLMENFIENFNVNKNNEILYTEKEIEGVSDKRENEDKFYDYISYIILACQYIMNKTTKMIMRKTTESTKIQRDEYEILDFPLFNKAQKILLELSENTALRVKTRSDCIDILLKMGDKETNKRAQTLIISLGGKGINIYENTQNVHNVEIEQSVVKILEFLHNLPNTDEDIYDIEDNEKDNGEVDEKDVLHNNKSLGEIDKTIRSIRIRFSKYIEEKFNINLKKLLKSREEKNKNGNISCIENTDYQTDIKVLEMYDKIEASLTRIVLDRQLYSRFNWSLKNILIRTWKYIHYHKHKDTMTERLFEELVEMSGWCSSGYASRIVNSICGFGDFTINVGFENQIKANLTGRLNKKIMDIQDMGLRELLLDEMTERSGDYLNRKLFLKFFRESIPSIKEELYSEFREYVSDTDFDLYMVKAIQHYEGDNY